MFRDFFTGRILLTYSREFVDASGVTRTANGQLSFPTLGGLPGSTNVAASMLSDVLPVSADGLRVGHFLKIASASSSDDGSSRETTQANEIYELEIGLAAVPTLQLRSLDSWQDHSSQIVVRDIHPNGSFSLVSVEGTLHNEVRSLLGYFNDVRAMLKITTDKEWSGSGSQSPTGGGFCSGSWPFLNYREQSIRQDVYSVGLLSSTNVCSASTGTVQEGKVTVESVTHRAGDAIYREPPPAGPLYAGDGTVLYNPGIPASGTAFVRDASPLGEIFVAKPDLSVVIHKPRAGGMQQVVIPPNTVRLLAALWL